MTTKKRVNGTQVTIAESPEERIAAIRKVVSEKQYAKIDGQMADLFTCNTIMTVYGALNQENQLIFASLPFRKMASVAFKLVS